MKFFFVKLLFWQFKTFSQSTNWFLAIFWNCKKWNLAKKNFAKLIYFISRVFLAWTFLNFLAYCEFFLLKCVFDEHLKLFPLFLPSFKRRFVELEIEQWKNLGIFFRNYKVLSMLNTQLLFPIHVFFCNRSWWVSPLHFN